MKKLFGLAILLTACYSQPVIENFDKSKWVQSIENCDGYRDQAVDELLKQQDKLLGKNQNEMINLLGKPLKNELYNRNQKFLYYRLDCKDEKQLMIVFDALGRTNELRVISIKEKDRDI